MKAVNLIPSDGRRGSRGGLGMPNGPSYIVVGLLAVAVAFVTIYVLSTNTISSRKVQVAELQVQASQAQAQAASLTRYTQFAKLAQARAQTVQQIAATRFDWHAALADLSKVVPADTSLQSLVGSVAPGATVASASGGGGSAGTSSLRGAIPVPAFELSGCTKNQDDVARLMSRLRVINGVTRVTLGDSRKSATAQSAVAVAGAGQAVGCGANGPTFDLVVFFSPLAGAGATGPTAPTAQPVSTPAGAAQAAGAATGTQPASTTATPASTTATPVTSTTSGGSK